MQAVRVHEYGDADVLRVEEVSLPEPGAGEARVRIEASGVNFIDTYQRRGWNPVSLPYILGMEAAGVVEAVGSEVTDVRPGDRVAFNDYPGGYAQHAIVPVAKLVPVPEGVDSPLAAAVLLQGMTAHYLTHSTYPLQRGETALIHAAAGGVGQVLVQLAKRRGARVIGTVSNEEKATLARQAGADEIIIYTQTDFEAETRRLTDGRGVDVVYDSVGKDTFDKSLSCLQPRGYMVLFGQSSGPVPPVDPQLLNARGSLYLTRPRLGHYIADRQELLWRASDLFAWIANGSLTVRVDRTFPLAEAAEAHRYLEGRQTRGKVLLLP